MTTRTRPRRRAFTLPELLVVVTITLVLMSILVTASGIITNTLSGAKAQGDLVAQERMALAALKRDLQANHFLDQDGKPGLGRRLSDQRTDQVRVQGGRITGYLPPRSGYFQASSRPAQTNPFDLSNTATWNFDEGTDSNTFSSSRSANHFIQFTVVLPGGAPENTVTADVPFGNPRNSPSHPIIGTAAEVAYFLVPNGTTPQPPAGNGVPKFKLIRRQRLVARNADDAPAYQSLLNSIDPNNPNPPVLPDFGSDVGEVMAVTGNPLAFQMLNLNQLTFANNRLSRVPITRIRVGEDVLHHSVTSFEIKFAGTAAPPAVTGFAPGTTWPTPFANGNTDYPFDNLPFDGNFDTFHQGPNWELGTNLGNASNTAGALKPIRLTAVQIRLRIWNQSTKTTRQTTLVVDL